MGNGQVVQGAVGGLSREGVSQDKAELEGLVLGVSEPVVAGEVDIPVPRRRTQQERRAEAEARLLASALSLLAHKGWVGMTLAEVGEKAGYSRGQAAHHFGSKGALLRALTVYIKSSFMQEMDAASPSPDGLQAVLGFVRVYLGRSDSTWTNTRALLLLLTESMLNDSEVAEVMAESNHETFSLLEDNLRVGIAQGEVRSDVDPALGAQFVVGAMRGMSLERLRRGSEADTRGIIDQVVRLVERTFAVPTPHISSEGTTDG